MRLIRLTSENPLGIFSNTFNSTITIKPKSKICLTSLTSEEAVEGLTINDSNDTIRVQLAGGSSPAGGIKTIRLTHAVYKDTDFDLFFADFTNKLNATIVAKGAGVGYEYKVALDNAGKVSILGKRSPYRVNAIPTSSWIKEGVIVDNSAKKVWSSISPISTNLNNISMGLEQLFCNGGGVFSCRINTLIDEDPLKNGFVIGLTQTDPTTFPNYDVGIIEHAISVDSDTGNYSYIHKGVIQTTTTPVAYQGVGINTNPVLTIQLTENQYKYVVYDVNNAATGIELFSIPRTADDKNQLYPFISFRGGRDNCKVESVRYTASPFNVSPYSQVVSYAVELPNSFTAEPSQPNTSVGTVQFVEFASLALTTYLGFTQQVNPPLFPIKPVAELNVVSPQEFVPTSFTDSFIVELLNLTVDSYDGSTSGRRNILAVIPQSYNEKQQIVFQATNLLWIDLLNAFPVDLRELKLRLVRDDNTPLRIRGISTAVLMIKDFDE